MSYHRGVARDTLGNSLNEASVTVYDAGTTTESTIYSEETLTSPLDNPFSTGEDGVYEFYVDPGFYDIQVAKSGFTTVTLTDQVIGQPFGSAHIDTAGLNSGITAPEIVDTTWGNLDWVLDYAGGFSLAATTLQLVYDGNPSGKCLLNGSVNFSCDSVAGTFLLWLVRERSGETLLAQSTVAVNHATGYYQLVINAVDDIENGDIFILRAGPTGSTENVTINDGWISATYLG